MKTHLDLFSGIGGFAIAAQACGYTTIGFCEKEPYAQEIIITRFGAVLANAKDTNDKTMRSSGRRTQMQLGGSGSGKPCLHPDIFTLNGAEYAGVDLLTGGFPCQPFSVAGKREGAADDRALWPEMLRVIDEAKPAWIIGENVAGIVTMELDNILSDLEGIGYTAWPVVIPACAVDAKHRRDRVWIIARRDVAHADVSRRQGYELLESSLSPRPGETLADADSQRGCVRNSEREDATDARESSEPRETTHARQPQSEFRGMAHGLSEGLDEGGVCCWPEEDPETPRVSTLIKHRAHRLKGLGNAIVPQVAIEIIRLLQ